MIAPQPFFEPRGTPFSVLGRLRALSKLGHSVDLLTYHIGKDISIPGVRIYRIPSIPFIRKISIGPSITKLILDVFLFFKAFIMVLRKKYDLIHTHEEASFFGIVLARLFRARHLYDMHSSLPQQLSNFRYTRFRPIVGLFKWLEYRVVTSSQAVITICPALEEQVKKITPRVPQVMIENVVVEGDPEEVSEEAFENFKKAYSLGESRIILYMGTFEPYQGIDLLIASAARVVHKYEDVVFLLLGGTPDQVQFYQGQVKELGLDPFFRFTGTRPPEEMPLAIRLCDILVSPRISGTNTPLKIYSYLHSGRPIVATDLPTHTQVLTPELAVLVDPVPDALAKGIFTVLENPGLARELAASTRSYFDKHYSFQNFVQKTQQALQMAIR